MCVAACRRVGEMRVWRRRATLLPYVRRKTLSGRTMSGDAHLDLGLGLFDLLGICVNSVVVKPSAAIAP